MARLTDDERTAIEAVLARNARAVTPTVRLTDSERFQLQQMLALNLNTLPGPELSNLTIEPPIGETPLDVIVNVDRVGIVDSWSCDFGDGAAKVTTAPPWAHTYVGVGTFEIVVEAQGPLVPDEIRGSVQVDAAAPGAPVVTALNPVPAAGAAPLAVHFTVVNSGGAAQSWEFDPGDGSAPLTTPPPWDHTYTAADVVTATATAQNASGSDSDSALVTVT